MKLILAIPAAGLLLSGAMNLHRVPLHPSTELPPSSSDIPATVTPTAPPRIWADNALLYRGEVLKIHFDTPHPRYLGVSDPDGHFFYVVFPADENAGNLQPLVNSRDFISLNSLSIRTSTFTADPYTYGVLENQPVFTKTGTYRFVLGENLHMDDESTLGILKVDYRHTARPKKAVSTAVVYAGN